MAEPTLHDKLEIGDIAEHVEILAAAIRVYPRSDDEDDDIFLEARVRNRTDEILEEVKCDVSFYCGATFLGLDRTDYEEVDKLAPQQSLGFDLRLHVPEDADLIVINIHAVKPKDDMGELRRFMDKF